MNDLERLYRKQRAELLRALKLLVESCERQPGPGSSSLPQPSTKDQARKDTYVEQVDLPGELY